MSLPLPVINRLFDRLSATYGRDFISRWDGLDANTVKSAWAYELSGVSGQLDSLAWALENLPERAPNLIEFRNLCRKSPRVDAPRLESPKADPVLAAMILAKLRAIVAPSPLGMKAWARRLKARHEAGERLNPYQIMSYKVALAGELTQGAA
jgi:hypothetical protein